MTGLRVLMLAAVAAAWTGSAPGAVRAEERVDLELVLAADVSLSMDIRELRLQRAGYAAAIQAPPVIDAIEQGFDGKIAVTFVEWAGTADQHVTVPWHTIASRADAARFAAAIDAAPLRQARRTSIAAALATAAALFEDNGYRGYRRVIDVSGDGPNNQGKAVHVVRDGIVAEGIVINGLPMMLDPLPVDWYNIPDLDAYYRECVIGGIGAFYVPVQNMAEFEDALIRKLVLEIAGLPPAPRLTLAATRLAATAEAYDCLVGEKLWRRRMQFLE